MGALFWGTISKRGSAPSTRQFVRQKPLRFKYLTAIKVRIFFRRVAHVIPPEWTLLVQFVATFQRNLIKPCAPIYFHKHSVNQSMIHGNSNPIIVSAGTEKNYQTNHHQYFVTRLSAVIKTFSRAFLNLFSSLVSLPEF